MTRNYPPRGMENGREVVGLRPVDAVYTVGGLALEFIYQAETWPVFFDWLCSEEPAFKDRDPATVREDVRRVIAVMPPRAAGKPQRRAP